MEQVSNRWEISKLSQGPKEVFFHPLNGQFDPLCNVMKYPSVSSLSCKLLFVTCVFLTLVMSIPYMFLTLAMSVSCTFLSHVMTVPCTFLSLVMSIPCTFVSLVMSGPYTFLSLVTSIISLVIFIPLVHSSHL